MRNLKFTNLFAVVSLLMAASFFVTSCDKNNESETQYIPVQLSEGGAWVFIDANGERVGNQEWEFEPTVTVNDLFTVRTDSGLTVYKWSDNVATPIDSLTNLVCVGEYNEGLLPVTPAMKRIRIVDGDGEVKFVLDPIDGVEVTSCASKVTEGLLVVTTVEGKTGVVNKKGEVVVAPKYSSISAFNDGYAVGLIDNIDNYEKGPEYYIIDKDGNSTRVNGQFGYSEGDCFTAPEFENGKVIVAGPMDSVKNEFSYCEINTEGEVTKLGAYTNIFPLENGGTVVYKWSDEKSSYEWFGPDNNLILKTGDGEYMEALGKYVGVKGEDSYTVYTDTDQKLLTLEGNVTCTWPGGKFGIMATTYSDDFSSTEYRLYNDKGELLNGRYYGVGNKLMISIDEAEDYEMCENVVTSAYVDITAAATKLVSMITQGVKGKKVYLIGDPVASILEGENAKFYSGSGLTFTLPSESGYSLATGAGFWVTGTGKSSATIVAPTYRTFYDDYGYDYGYDYDYDFSLDYGWGYRKQVGVHFNQNARVVAFDLILHTNHSSGTPLKEAVSRRLKKDGFTLVAQSGNYDEFTNGITNVVIYGSDQSNGIGAYITEKGTNALSDSEKAGKVASI